MRRPTALAFMLLAFAAGRAGAQDATYLRFGGEVGQNNKYQAIVEMYFRSPQMAAMMSPDTSLPTMRFTRALTRTIASVTGDTITMMETVDSSGVDTPAMPQMAAMMGAAAAMERGKVTTTRMDTRGRIISVQDSNPNMADMGAGGPGGRGGRGMGNMPGRNQRMMFVLPARAVRPGDTWTDSMVVTGTAPGEPSTNFLATYKLESITPRGNTRVAVISMNGSMAINSDRGPQVMSTGGEIQFDVTARRVASFTMTLSGTAATPQGDIPIRVHMTQALVP